MQSRRTDGSPHPCMYTQRFMGFVFPRICEWGVFGNEGGKASISRFVCLCVCILNSHFLLGGSIWWIQNLNDVVQIPRELLAESMHKHLLMCEESTSWAPHVRGKQGEYARENAKPSKSNCTRDPQGPGRERKREKGNSRFLNVRRI